MIVAGTYRHKVDKLLLIIFSMQTITLNNGKLVKVDSEDFPFLNRFLWYVNTDSKKPNNTRVITNIRGKTLNMHEFIMDHKSFKQIPVEVTHKNKDWFDYTKENLLILTRSEMRNFNRKRKDNTSGYKGVWFHCLTGKATAEIQKDGVRYRLGWFETAQEAAQAYNNKALELFGPTAYQNKI